MAWNGKSVDDIGAIYGRYHQQNDFASELVSYLSQTELQKEATWLLKKYLGSDGYRLSENSFGLFLFRKKLSKTPLKSTISPSGRV